MKHVYFQEVYFLIHLESSLFIQEGALKFQYFFLFLITIFTGINTWGTYLVLVPESRC